MERLGMDDRMTICNMAIEAAASRVGRWEASEPLM
ncbi:hypothetical protein [Hydrogenophaga sp.]